VSFSLHLGEFLSLACALTWAVAIMFFRKSGERVTPVALNLFKNIVALAMFAVTLPLIGVPWFPADQGWQAWAALLLSGAIGLGIADSLFFASLNRLGAANSAIVDSLYSPFVIVCAWLYLSEPIGPSLIIAVCLMAGAILVGTWEPRRGPRNATSKTLLAGIALGVVAMLLMAIGIVMAKPVLSNSNAWWAASVRLLGGALFLSVHGMMPRHRADVVRCFKPSSNWRYTMPAAVIGAYIAMILWILGMKLTFATVASVLNQMSTIFTLILAAIFLKEKITARRAIAIVMAFAGALIVAL